MSAVEWIAQIFGGLAITSSLIIYSGKTRKRILLFKASQDVCWLIHYLLMAAYPAAATSGLCFFRSFIYYREGEKEKRNPIWLIVFLLLYALSAVWTWKSIFSIFPAVSSSISAIAFWMKKPRHIKMLSIAASCCTLIYNLILAHSPAVYVGVFFTVCTSLYSLLVPQKKTE